MLPSTSTPVPSILVLLKCAEFHSGSHAAGASFRHVELGPPDAGDRLWPLSHLAEVVNSTVGIIGSLLIDVQYHVLIDCILIYYIYNIIYIYIWLMYIYVYIYMCMWWAPSVYSRPPGLVFRAHHRCGWDTLLDSSWPMISEFHPGILLGHRGTTLW